MDTSTQLMHLILCRHTEMGLRPQETLVLLHLADLGGMQVTVSHAELGRRMNLSRRRVKGIVSSLIQRGLLSAKRTTHQDGGHGCSTYDLGAFLLAYEHREKSDGG